MAKNVSEQDWKAFLAVRETAMDAFYAAETQRIKNLMNGDETDAEKFAHLCKTIKHRQKQARALFDGHTRSNVTLRLLGLRIEGLVSEEDLRTFSQDLIYDTAV